MRPLVPSSGNIRKDTVADCFAHFLDQLQTTNVPKWTLFYCCTGVNKVIAADRGSDQQEVIGYREE